MKRLVNWGGTKSFWENISNELMAGLERTNKPSSTDETEIIVHERSDGENVVGVNPRSDDF